MMQDSDYGDFSIFFLSPFRGQRRERKDVSFPLNPFTVWSLAVIKK